MTQTIKGNNGTPQKQTRPGQRQQERLMRIARRRRRRQIWFTSIASVVIVTFAVLGILQYQQITAQRAANQVSTATAVANAHVKATATAVTRNCFIASSGATQVPPVYDSKATPAAGPTAAPLVNGTPVKGSDGLQYIDIKMGSGKAIKKNSVATVEYTGWLASTCQKFDSSWDNKGQSFSLPIGQGQVIKGWDEGLIGMKAGGIRRLYLPASLAYGPQGTQDGRIPPNATLIFDVTLLSVK